VTEEYWLQTTLTMDLRCVLRFIQGRYLSDCILLYWRI